MEKMMLPFILYSQNAERRREMREEREDPAKQQFSNYSDKANDCFGRCDFEGFIHYSSLALKTGWYNSDLYYKRGIAFEQLNDFKHAKKEYEKAVKYGCDAAETALEKLKDHEKEWKERQQ
ncbi:hypothetical protein [uncultured Prevotella sp.]|uniref:hypothetical protein n=1 Tax=uncultured Prevotella sp. TaxID=159272 RepID=UPI002594FA48|nr:hypothetical protein [uncultured Prevotella sp.]